MIFPGTLKHVNLFYVGTRNHDLVLIQKYPICLTVNVNKINLIGKILSNFAQYRNLNEHFPNIIWGEIQLDFVTFEKVLMR